MSDSIKQWFVNSTERDWETWTDWGLDANSEIAASSQIHWKTLISGDRTDSQRLSAGIAWLGPGKQLAPHGHARDEIYYILEGQPTVRVGEQTRVLTPGTTVFIPSDEIHSIKNDHSEPVQLLYVFAADTFEEVVYKFVGIDN